MKKKNNKGFMLAETLIVTTFVAGVLIFLFIQFSKLNSSYSEYYVYNTSEGLYALNDIKSYIESDSEAIENISNSLTNQYIDLTDCEIFSNTDYCLKLFELENIKKIYILRNYESYSNINFDSETLKFMKKIKKEGDETHRIVALFNNGSLATVRFGNIDNSTYTDTILNGSDPDLYDNTLTPVIYDGDNWVIADVSEKWYDYENQWWANAVILNESVRNTKQIGDTVNVEGNNPEALAMFVWIPRYEYKIDGTYGTHTNGTVGTQALPGKIEVNFISKDTTTANTGYRIHPSFNFGGVEQSGIWVGKFELSYSEEITSPNTYNNLNCSNESCTRSDGIRILPGRKTLVYNNVSNFFYASRSMARSGNAFGLNSSLTDSHMIKNSEWGSVAYLTQSLYGKYGNSNYNGENKEIYINNSEIDEFDKITYYTGKSGGSTNAEMYDEVYDYDYATGNLGIGASTTGNIYGIYDMNGGASEYVMGVFADSSGTIWTGDSASVNSGFVGRWGTPGYYYGGTTLPNQKYYDIYKNSSDYNVSIGSACNGQICYGHALSETYNWYLDGGESSIDSDAPWIIRNLTFYVGSVSGTYYSRYTSRYVLSNAT